MMTEPAEARDSEAVPTTDLSVDSVLARFDGDYRAALAAALSDIAHMRQELQFASLAMSYGFTRGWKPSVGAAIKRSVSAAAS